MRVALQRQPKRRRAQIWATTLMAASILAGPSAAAQSEIRERVDVRLVTVDVWVTDRDGRPVRGLGVDEFEIFEDGRPVKVEHFTEIYEGSPVTATEASEASTVPHHVVLYLDRSRMRPGSYQTVLDEIERFLSSDVVEAENVLLLQQTRGITIVSPLGSSRRELLDAIERLAREDIGGPDLENEVQLALDAIRDTYQQSRDLTGSGSDTPVNAPGTGAGTGGFGSPGGSPRDVVSGRGSPLGTGADSCRTFHNQIQPILDSWAANRGQRVALSLSNLSEISTSLAGLSGVKSLFYFSDGLDTEPGAALAVYASGLCPARGTNLLSNAHSESLRRAFDDLIRRAASNRVTIYPIESPGARAARLRETSSGRGSSSVGRTSAQSSFESTRRIGERSGLHLLAQETGGRAVVDQDELAAELRALVEDSRHHYSLAYSPAEPSGGEATVHEIELEVRGEGLETRYRRAYLEEDLGTWMNERVLGALNLGIAENPLEARLGAGEVSRADEGNFRFPLHVMVPVERLAFVGSDEPLAELHVSILARHLDTGAVASREQTYRLRGGPDVTGFADLPIELVLQPGVYVTAVGVRDEGSRTASFISTTLQVGGDS